jgi:hypothetical protein
MGSQNLHVVPTALRAASAIVAGHAQLPSPAYTDGTSTEAVAVAADSFARAFGDFSAAFSHRLSLASAALVGAAGAFKMNEDNSSAALKSVSLSR